MKVFLVGQKGIPSKSGGVETHVQELALRLVKAGHDVYAYTRPNYTDKNLEEFQGVKLISLPSVSTKHLDAISHTFFACLDLIRRKPDIIHFHSIGPSSLIWLVKLLKPGVPVVSTFHTKCYLHQKWNFLAKVYLKFGEWVTCHIADKTIAISKSLQEYAKNEYGSDAIYIPNGVPLVKSRKAKEILEKYGLKKDEYILLVSRLVKHKGISYAIKAFNKLKTSKKLVIVGGGSFTDKYVQEVKNQSKRNENVILTGPQSGKVLKELFSNAYLFIQPSESEGLSISLLEAMAYGRGVLVSDISENKEAIGDCGHTFKNKSVKDLQAKMAYLLENEELVVKSGRLGRRRVRKFYDWNDITTGILKTYDGLKKEKSFNLDIRENKLLKKVVNRIF